MLFVRLENGRGAAALARAGGSESAALQGRCTRERSNEGRTVAMVQCNDNSVTVLLICSRCDVA